MSLGTEPDAGYRRQVTRDPVLDNARALLITLVVTGHVIGALGVQDSRPLFLWIYSFHMAGFVLISGHLSREAAARPKDVRRLITTLLVPYLVFQTILLVIRGITAGGVPTLDLVHPAFAMWFLLALAFWRLITPVLRALRGALVLAVAVSVIVPIDQGLDQQGSLARILGFLPFFVLGLLLREEHLTWLRRPAVRVVAAVGLVGGLAALWVLDINFSAAVLQLDGPYPEGAEGAFRGMVVRLVVLAVGALGGLAVLAISSGRPRWYTAIGERSLTVYLLHAVVLYPFIRSSVTLPGGAPAALAAGVALTLLLGSAPVARATRWLIHPPAADRLLGSDISGTRRMVSPERRTKSS